MKKQRYPIYEEDKRVGVLTVDFTLKDGYVFTADLTQRTRGFLIDADENGHVSEKRMEMWLVERIIPPTRVNIDEKLREMSLSEYDELGILKFTQGRGPHDTMWFDFDNPLPDE